MKILTVLGARPQFIKAGSLSREIAKHKEIEEIIVHTGQHYDSNMSDIFFEEMQIPKPDYFLGIGGNSHGAMTGQMIEKIEEVALTVKPDWILVYGDTNSTLAGAIVASKLHIKLTSILERVGFYEDYLDKWIENAFEYLLDKIKKEDIVFATSGGELGMIKLGSRLKYKVDCKFVVNFRDPLNYGYMNGLRRDNKFHIGREKAHEKYISNADLILTSSQYYADVLNRRFTSLDDKIVNNYFGYIKHIDISKYIKIESKRLRIAYVGTMSSTQKPELLYQAYSLLEDSNIELYFIGNIKNYKPLQNIKEDGVNFIDFLPHDEFLKFMSENIDVGFVSLTNEYFGACVPSKIYEYINLELPMIGALPLGDGREIINDKNYGIACDYNDIQGLSDAIKNFKDTKYIDKIKKSISKDKEKWYMKNTILEVDKLLRKL